MIGFIITLVGITFIEPLLFLFGASADTLLYAKDYMFIIFGGAVFSILSSTLISLIRGDGNPKLSANIMIIGFVINIILDVFFVFVLHMGIQGAALGSVLGQMLSTILGMQYYLNKNSQVKLYKANLLLQKDIIFLIISLGATPFFMQISASFVHAITNTLLKAYGGDVAIGAMTTIVTILIMVGMPVAGMSQGSQTIIGYNFGAKNYDRAESALKLSVIASSLFLTVCWLCILLFSKSIVGIFNPDPALVDATAHEIVFYLVMLPIMGYAMLGTNYMQAIGKAKEALMLILL